mgnify:FL=1
MNEFALFTFLSIGVYCTPYGRSSNQVLIGGGA